MNQIEICRDEYMEKVCIEDCCEILDSMRIPITASDRQEGSYPYYGANGVQDHVADYIFDDELVLLAEDGGNFGSKDRPIAYRVSGKCWVNNHAHVLKPKADLDVDYLCYSLMFYNVGGMVNGATRQKLTQAAMRKMLIPKRNIDEQRHIVSIMAKVVAIRKYRQRQLDVLDNLIKARFVELFGDPIKNTRSLKVRRLEELGTWNSGGTPSRTKPEYFTGDIDWYSAGELNSLYLHGSIEKITASAIEESAAKLFRAGSMLVGMYDTAAFKMGILKEDSASNQACACIEPNESVNIVWLYYALSLMKENYLSQRRGVRQKNLNLGMIRGFELPVAEKIDQDEFVTFVGQVDKSKVAVQKSLDETQRLFDSLMQEYFG